MFARRPTEWSVDRRVSMNNHIKFPVPTGHGAQILGTTEPVLADTVRTELSIPP